MEKLKILKVVTQDVGVLIKDDKNEFYTLVPKTFEFVKCGLTSACFICPEDFMIIDICHELTNDKENEYHNPYYRKNYGYTDNILEYLRKHCKWKKYTNHKRFNGIDKSKHVMVLENVKTVAFGYNDRSDVGAMYMHFHNIKLTNIIGEESDFESSVKNIDVETFEKTEQNWHVSGVNFLGCHVCDDMKIVIRSDDIIDAQKTHAIYDTLTLLNCKIIAPDDDPVIFKNTYGLLSGYIDSSIFSNMHILANNISVNNSSLCYNNVKEGVPYSCIFHDRYDNTKSDAEFKLRMYNSNLCLEDDIEFTCNVKLYNVTINPFSSKCKDVYYHNLDFFLPSESDERYWYRIVKSKNMAVVKNSTTSNIFNTYIDLYVDEYQGIKPHKVTVTIESLRCDMHRKNRHLFIRAYVLYGSGRHNGVYPLDVLLRDFSKTAQAKFNRKQVKEFYKNIDMIAELSGINLSIF